MQKITQTELSKILKDKVLRGAIAQKSFWWFLNMYFMHYLGYGMAPFHKKIISWVEENNNDAIAMMGFRNCGKSTLLTTLYPIWAILGKKQLKFVVIMSQTQSLVRQHINNILKEIESNERLKQDLGPFEFEEDGKGIYYLTLKKFNARIVGCSMEQSIRGLRHGAYRPQLLILDDIEDLASVKSREMRDKAWEKVTGEIIPAGSSDTKLVALGSKLHQDSVMMKLKGLIDMGALPGHALEVPIIDEEGKIAWPQRFPTMKDIEALKKKVANDIAWMREYCLKIISSDFQIIDPKWIQYYDHIPARNSKNNYRLSATGIDPAISLSTSADYTAMVSADLFGYEKDIKIYIHPFPVNQRCDFDGLLKTAMRIADDLIIGTTSKSYVEDNAYQKGVVQELERYGYPVEGVTSLEKKEDRLAAISHLIKTGVILFPKEGAEQLIEQIIFLGSEKHDDLADAFSLLARSIVNWSKNHKGSLMVTNLPTSPEGVIEYYRNSKNKVETYRFLESLNKRGFFLR
ncbi:MAG: hypothetical protein NTZ49_03890 [Candidatus Parcubacteria bacterium]|nr:hypothetical protein [Candidatus Parcubacteria bacterium]